MFKSLGFWQYCSVIGFLIVTLINPNDYFTWVIEVVWIFAGLAILFHIGRRQVYPTTLLAWCLVLHAAILIYGAWYTYAHVPLGHLCSEWFGWERNHYDRLGHFAQGFFPAVLIREVLFRNNVVNGTTWREFLVFACAMAFTGIFEIIEFAAAMAFGDGATAYLGSQGDVWDAQWDMLWCGAGVIASIAVLAKRHYFELARIQGELHTSPTR